MFYDFLQNQIKVLFKPRFDDVEPRTEFEVLLSKKMTYDMVSLIIPLTTSAQCSC